MSSECVFCGIVSGDAPARMVAQSDGAIAFLDIAPAGEGHTLVIPRSHAADIWSLSATDADDVWRLTMHVAERLRDVLRPDGLTLFQANGAAGWQDVFHLHVHLIPRWRGDTLTKPWESVPGDPTRLDEIAALLSPAGAPER
jgi:histidine triad (HIT) family protein